MKYNYFEIEYPEDLTLEKDKEMFKLITNLYDLLNPYYTGQIPPSGGPIVSPPELQKTADAAFRMECKYRFTVDRKVMRKREAANRL
jgi:hypothetical protein